MKGVVGGLAGESPSRRWLKRVLTKKDAETAEAVRRKSRRVGSAEWCI
jgi:hypothetical protein